MMKIKYITLLISVLALSGCGTDNEAPKSAKASSAQLNTTPAEIAASPTVNAVTTAAVTSNSKKIVTKTTTANNVEKTEANNHNSKELPLGRLTGIIDTGTYKQAIIDNQGQVIRLKEGDIWQGWTVTTIHPAKIAISHAGEEHSLLLLSEFRSPELTETELENKANQQDKNQNTAVQDTASDSNAQAFTEEQLTELRSRLLVGR